MVQKDKKKETSAGDSVEEPPRLTIPALLPTNQLPKAMRTISTPTALSS